ncbi:bifunctional helix-turn-helix transcriptional regulator/GNAT family N-acetyltransferase [Paraburkholderia caledonica]|uniref:bifunctional helix-turn-helix transcriptional regulator/GNAT family N-acetyltransferase n=1 Tax=Paraburkholderia caledonica TaxID=134536 RepID=UPI000372D671|nr:helix-turn-helix domain-containing GNAT family N-acetyltransferase [Paraburkholderia caledonica]
MDIIDIPAQSRDSTILELREFSRKLVRELGFMRSTLADSGLAPSAVHAILEVGATPGIQVRDLAHLLRLDKSNASRQVAKLESAGLIKRTASSDDARSSELYLTKTGQQLRKKIDKFATDQVSSALRKLAPSDQQSVVRALSLYAGALEQDNDAIETQQAPLYGLRIVEGYQPGCIGDIASLHARYYSQQSDFGVYFEKLVATGLSEFAGLLPDPGRQLWLVVDNGRTLASIAIDGNMTGRVAHLRWFIVDDSLRGLGVGRELMARAMAFVDERFDETYLWTFEGLDAARHLYEAFGFRLAEAARGTQWGKAVVEQRFVRRKAASRRFGAKPD